MLRGIAATLALVGACSLMACGANAGRTTPSSQQTVEGVLQEQANQDGGSTQANPTNSAFVGDKSPAFAQIDYDLTTMSSDMVYATVNDMVTTPRKYVGKTVRMKGPFQHSYYEPCGRKCGGGVSVGHKRDLWQESLSITLHCQNNRVQYICTQ